MKFVRPLYRALFASEMGKKVAVATFVKHRDFYHPVCAKMLAKDLELYPECFSNTSAKSQKHLLIGVAILAASAIGITFYRCKRL
jgi:hypothetical protein